MRVTTQQMYETLLSGVRKQLQIYADRSEQASSGRRFTRPSQDGLGYKTSLDIRHVQSGIQAGLKAINTAKLRLGASQNALSQILPVIQRAQVLAVQQASASLGSADRQVAATEVAHLQEQLLALANETFEGAPLFSGTATDTAPISLDLAGNAQYQGNSQDRLVAITSTQTIISNVRADHAAFTQAFASIQAFKTALSANDVNGIQNSIDSLNAAGDAMADLTAEVGGRLRSIDMREQTFLDMQMQMEMRLNEHEAVDIAEVATRLSQAQTTLQASYAAIARLNNLSLVQFLR